MVLTRPLLALLLAALALFAPASGWTSKPIVADDAENYAVDTTSTAMGEACLAGWLLAPAPPPVIAERQAAVTELAPHR